MTVERASAGHITVSRRLQHDGRLRPGCAVPAVPLGLLGDDVIFRAGSRLHRCSLSTVLPGLPASLADRTLARLRRTPEFQWLRRRTDGSLSLGLTTGVKPSGETRVRLVDVVSDSCALGVLAWQGDERRPRWMPAGETGWTVPGR